MDRTGASPVADRPPAGAAAAWAPLRQRLFLMLWSATLLAHVGTGLRDFGAGWLMTSLSPSATAVALVQVAGALPVFLFALLAGALADIVDRRRLLIALQLGLAAVALGLGLATDLGLMTPALLLLGLAAAGTGMALAQPAQQALTPRLVERPLLRPAMALNSLAVNLARAGGPLLGAAAVLAGGVAAAFYAAALCQLGLVAALWWWREAARTTFTGPRERVLPAMRAGLRYARHAPPLRRLLARSALFFVFASAYWALLPLIARQVLGGGPALYGVLLGCLGAGAVAGALVLPRLRARWSAEALLRAGTLGTAGALLLLAAWHAPLVAALALLLAGAAWIAVLTTLGAGVQTQLPDWVRGRGLALQLTVFQGAMALGGLGWGQLADRTTVPAALAAAAGLGGLTLLLAWRRPVPEDEPDLEPARHWPDPVATPALAEVPEHAGPEVLVTVEYRIAAPSVSVFLQALHELSLARRRDGASAWMLHEDAAVPGCFVESFVLPSWQEHLRQHQRVSHADVALQARLHALHGGGGTPLVRHFVVRTTTVEPAAATGVLADAPPRIA